MPIDVVVTGASGFIGSALLRQAREEGLTSTAVTRTCLPGFIHVASYVDTPFKEGAVLVHLAQGSDAGARFHDIDVEICRLLCARPWRHVIYASSAIVYGDASGHPRRPDERVTAFSDYTRVKLACEEIVTRAGGTCLRFANVYGPGMENGTVIADILHQIPGHGSLSVRDLSPVRDFLWIDDAARCIAAACRIRPGGVLNVGSGHSSAIADVARLAVEIAGESARTIVDRGETQRPSCLKLDITKTRSLLNWTPRVDIRQGLEILLQNGAHAK